MKGWVASGTRQNDITPEDTILPSLIQYGVKTPEAAVVSLLGIPRPFAEATASEYRNRHGRITPQTTVSLRDFLETTKQRDWNAIIQRSGISGLTGEDFYCVYRQMQGMEV